MAWTPTYKVSDLVTNVINKLSARTDINTAAKAQLWVRDAVLELTKDFSFEELKTTGPTVAFTSGLNIYDKNFFINNADLEATQVISFFTYTDSTGASTSTGYNLKFRTLPTIESMSHIPGLPRYWSRVGSNILFAPRPDQAYKCYMRYQKRHPFNPQDFNDDYIFMPDDWREIVEYAAAERGAINERMLDYAQLYHKIIFGDPNFEKSGGETGTPGLIFRRMSQFTRDAQNNERQLQPVVVPYTAIRG